MKRHYPIYRCLSTYALILSILAVPAVTVSQSGAQTAYHNEGKTMSPATPAAPGDLDPTFSGDGKLVEMPPPVPTQTGRRDSSSAVAVQPDGKIVVAGSSRNPAQPFGPSSDFLLARYNPDGSLDP